MNTLSILLTGQATQGLAFTPQLLHLHQYQHMSTNMSTTTTATTTRTPTSMSRSSSHSSTSTIRPSSNHKRSDSSSWYNTSDNLTLEDFEARLENWEKRFERWVSTCTTNIVMALLRPTPLVLFLFNPVCLIAIVLVMMVWVVAVGGGTG
jgi:hypothetical protein